MGGRGVEVAKVMGGRGRDGGDSGSGGRPCEGEKGLLSGGHLKVLHCTDEGGHTAVFVFTDIGYFPTVIPGFAGWPNFVNKSCLQKYIYSFIYF